MNKEQFWNIVNEVHSSTDPRNQKEVLTALRDRLRNLPSEEILEWKQIFSFYQDAARRSDLWAASAAMGAHSSDDGFRDMDTLMEFSIQGDIFFFYDTLSEEEKETVRKCMRARYKGHIVGDPKIDEFLEELERDHGIRLKRLPVTSVIAV